MAEIPVPSIERLALVYNLLSEIEDEKISSSGIGSILGIPAHTIRKDLSYLGSHDAERKRGSAYSVGDLRESLERALGFGKTRKACIVGLGRLGSAILNYTGFLPADVCIDAGFDISMNTIELMETSVPLFPAYRMTEIVRERQIELAVLTVPASAAQKCADMLMDGGVRGVVNFAPCSIKIPNGQDVLVRNIYLAEEFRVVSAMLNLFDTGGRNGSGF